MKVGFLGNTNNYPFVIASQMKLLGCEVVMYVDAPKGDLLNRPEHYATDISYPYPVWIKEKISLGKSLNIHFPQLFEREVIRELNTCDAVILNGYGHRFKNFINPSIPSVSMFSGGDLEIMADYRNVAQMKLSNRKLRFVPTFLKTAFARFSVDQLRKGIAKASLVSYFPKGLVPVGDRLLDEIFKNKPYYRFEHLHVNPDGHDYVEPADNEVFRIFSLTRFMWKLPFPPGRSEAENKGNDIMIKGIALFLKLHPKPIEIHFVEKGLHVAETKALIEELGFARFVTWHKEMPFKDLSAHMIKANVIFEQLGTHYISGGFYAMLRGRPVIGNAQPQILDKLTGEKTPVCHATTADEVCEWLVVLSEKSQLAGEIGKRSREYVLRHFNIMNESAYFKQFLERNGMRVNGDTANG